MSPLKTTLLSLLSLLLSTTTAQLNPNCRPGGNFDLSTWDLQLPTGSTDNPTIIPPSSLEGCTTGYQDPNRQYFFTESGDGALVMKVLGSPATTGCVTTPGSLHCRTELREIVPSSWSPNDGTNVMTVTLAVEEADESEKGTVIGQVHIDDSISSKPVCELYYNQEGTIQMGVEFNSTGGNETFTTIGTIPVGQQFNYKISYSSNVLSVSLNGGTPKTLSTFDLDAPLSYFKVGNYNQGNDPSDVHFFAISVEH